MQDDLTYHFVTNEIDVHFHRDTSDKDKYLVCTCARGENDYLIEYVKHYLSLDFDKIIICDNNNDDSVEHLLEPYIKSGAVEIFNCRGFNSFQVQFYSMFAHEGNYKWCGFFDADEYLELGVYTSIKDFLATVPEEDDSISFNWLTFGTNDEYHKTYGRVQDRFPQPIKPIVMFKENVFIKSILRGGYDRFQNCWFNGSHIPMCSNPVRYNIGGYKVVDYAVHTHSPMRYKNGYLKHYYTKSFDEWIKKSSRGWPDGTPTLTTSNFRICENRSDYNIENFLNAFFIDYEVTHNMKSRFGEMLDLYDVIEVRNSSKQVYAWLVQIIALMNETSNHVFIVTDEHIDDTLFNIVFEYALQTNNKLVFARNHDEVWKTFLRYSSKETYYIIDLK